MQYPERPHASRTACSTDLVHSRPPQPQIELSPLTQLRAMTRVDPARSSTERIQRRTPCKQPPPSRRSIAPASRRAAAPAGAAASAYQGYQIIRRNGAVVAFEPNKIAVALMKAFLAVHGTQGAASASVRETVDGLTEAVVRALLRSRPGGGTFHIEDVQDQVELGLMRGGHHEVARAYVLYRERRAQERAKQGAAGGRRRAGADTSSTAASACRSTWRGCRR